MCVTVYLYLCLCLCLCLYLCMPVHMTVSLSVAGAGALATSLFLCICISVCLCVCVSVSMSFCLYMCMYMCQCGCESLRLGMCTYSRMCLHVHVRKKTVCISAFLLFVVVIILVVRVCVDGRACRFFPFLQSNLPFPVQTQSRLSRPCGDNACIRVRQIATDNAKQHVQHVSHAGRNTCARCSHAHGLCQCMYKARRIRVALALCWLSNHASTNKNRVGSICLAKQHIVLLYRFSPIDWELSVT